MSSNTTLIIINAATHVIKSSNSGCPTGGINKHVKSNAVGARNINSIEQTTI